MLGIIFFYRYFSLLTFQNVHFFFFWSLVLNGLSTFLSFKCTLEQDLDLGICPCTVIVHHPSPVYDGLSVFFFRICLKVRVGGKRSKSFPSPGCLPTWPQWPALGQARARAISSSPEWVAGGNTSFFCSSQTH